MKKGIYLASFKALHPKYDIIYQDINGKRDLSGDMLDINLDHYDYIIASPPCNYWSRANYRRESSLYAQQTKHLLPDILIKLINIDKPFIVENVSNHTLFLKNDLLHTNLFIYYIGRHTYWSNILINRSGIIQFDDNIQNKSSAERQGGINVHNVIERFLETIY